MMVLEKPIARPAERLVEEYVRKYGGSSSNALLDPICEIFWDENTSGMIGYRSQGNCYVAFGDPLAPQDKIISVTNAFHSLAEAEKKSIIYLGASQNFKNLVFPSLCPALIEVGQELFINPSNYPKEGPNGRLLRKKVKHAEKEGSQVKEYVGRNIKIERAIEQVGSIWLQERQGPQIFLSHVHLFSDRTNKRWFYSMENGVIKGVLLLNRMDSDNGWLLNLLMITPDAHHGTSEMLVVHALDTLEAEGIPFLTFGITTGSHLGEIHGLSSISSWLAKKSYQYALKWFNLNGRRKFWEKFEPQGRPVYALFSNTSIKLGDIYAVIKALNVAL